MYKYLATIISQMGTDKFIDYTTIVVSLDFTEENIYNIFNIALGDLKEKEPGRDMYKIMAIVELKL